MIIALILGILMVVGLFIGLVVILLNLEYEFQSAPYEGETYQINEPVFPFIVFPLIFMIAFFLIGFCGFGLIFLYCFFY